MSRFPTAGETWGNLKVIEIDTQRFDSGGVWEDMYVIHFECDCGHAFSIVENDFESRLKTRNCGRVTECKFADEEAGVKRNSSGRRSQLGRPVGSGGPKSVFSVYLPLRIAERIRVYAEREEINFGNAIGRLADKALDAEDGENG